MSETTLFNMVYNPDVLTCLANLSNDEVFTPPEVANAMLDMLPQELFKNPDTTFLEKNVPNVIQTNVTLGVVSKSFKLRPEFQMAKKHPAIAA